MYFIHPQFHKFPLWPFFRKFSEAGLKNKLIGFFPNHHIVLTDSGRSAFQLAIQSLNLQNSEMLFPAYICDIFKPILEKYNIKPIYLDTDLKTFLADFSNIETKITVNTKSILICHTYGLPADMDRILEIAKKYDLKTIEDCAHLLIGLPRVESRGDALFFSFTKLFPVVDGGMLISKKPIEAALPKYKPRLLNIVKFLRLFPKLARITELFRKINPPSPLQMRGYGEIKGISMGCLRVVNYYLDNLEKQISKREKLAGYFHKKLREIGFQSSGITYISALVPKNINRDELFNKLRKRGIFCSRIWQNPICPNLPNTQEAAKRIINFPLQNWFTEKDIDEIIAGILSSMD